MAEDWERAQREGVTRLETEPFQPKQPEALAVQLGSRYCPSRIIGLEKIEDGIAALYQRIELPDAESQRLRQAVRGELAGQTADAHQHAERANRRLAQLTDERGKLLRAHLDGAAPVDLRRCWDRLPGVPNAGCHLPMTEGHSRVSHNDVWWS